MSVTLDEPRDHQLALDVDQRGWVVLMSASTSAGGADGDVMRSPRWTRLSRLRRTVFYAASLPGCL